MSSGIPGSSWGTEGEVAIIANPVSGAGRGRRAAEEAGGRLGDLGVKVRLHWTRGRGEATELALGLLEKGVRRIVGCGGDGTLHEVVNALALTEGVMGVIPGGRGNDLARALGIPGKPAQAAELLVRGEPRAIDLGRVGQRFFSTVATLGFDAEVSRAVMEKKMPGSGPSTYLFAVLRTLRTYRPRHVRIVGDFGEHAGPIFLAATANSPMYGGGMRIAPPARMDDGVLHLCLIEHVSRLTVLMLLGLVYSGRHVRRSCVHIHPVRRLTVESAEETRIYADGEFITVTPATIEVVPGALRVIAPSQSPAIQGSSSSAK